ncbi:response regulator transcription factor [Streptomyces ipomoeae]|uniref:response regulator transcription factor n=1 Tax=Streptomyces ipomoeae TaxID=103232 RepID=UPI001FD359C4|nr:response regulator transcription factor [Streptomyces ipomoeae]MDX2934050.1 response regulator transcription factor [Streptomyces ipomoeae]
MVAEAADGGEGLELAEKHLPDVALVDIQMPVIDGIEVTRRIAADPAMAGVHVVILTNYGLDEYVFDGLRAGAAGFLVKDIVPEDFLHAVRVAARGDALLAHGLSNEEIASRLVISPLTAKTHINRAMAKLHARDRAQLVVLAYESGLVSPRDS